MSSQANMTATQKQQAADSAEDLGKDDFVDVNMGSHELLAMQSLPSLLSEKPYTEGGELDNKSGSPLVAQDSAVRLSTTRTVFLTIAVLLTSFVGTASASAVTLLLPAMVRSLGGTQLEMQSMNSVYSLSLGCGALLAARLADMYGRRPLYFVGLVIYMTFIIITGVLRNRTAMIVTRTFAGLGLAIASPAGFGIVGTTIMHEPARTIVFAMFGIGGPIGGALGGLLGGGMAAIGDEGWAYLFFLLGGLAALIIVIAWCAIPPDDAKSLVAVSDRRIDWVGGLVVTAAICLFTISLIDSGVDPRGWAARHVPSLFALSLILFALFYLWTRHLERYTTYPPILKASMFSRHRGRITSTCAGAFCACLAMYMFMYNTSIYYQGHRGLSAWENAIRVLPVNVAGTPAAIAVVCLVSRYRTPYLIAAGGLASGNAALLYANRPAGTIFWATEFPAQCLVAWNIDLASTIGNILIANLAEQDEQSVGGGLFQTSCQIGSALGTALSSLTLNEVSEARSDLLEGLRATYWFSSAVAFLVIPIALLGLRGVGLPRDVRKSL